MQKVLENIGFTEKEAQIYLAALTLGNGTASEIGKAAGINRVTTYDILEKLKKKAFVFSSTKKKTKYFKALEPKKLVAEFEQRQKSLSSALSELEALNAPKQSQTQSVFFLEGTQALEQLKEGEKATTTNQNCEARIFKNQIALISHTDQLAIVIENPAIVEFQKELLQSKNHKTELLKPLKIVEEQKQAPDKKNLSLF